MQQWVWTTFNSFQWDLNYSNPAVFRAMLEEMFFIANTGVDILRLDAVAFIWKQMGTGCENLPEAHLLIQAFNRLARIATPGLLFKSEAIVHPDEVVKYISPQECQTLLQPDVDGAVVGVVGHPPGRIAHADPAAIGIACRSTPPGSTTCAATTTSAGRLTMTMRRRSESTPTIIGNFSIEFYTGQFPGSFARGVPFQENIKTGDMRISGTMASLAGLEQAIEEDDETKKELAIRRMLLLHGVTLSIGGIPLLYLGEEWGMLNDYDFVKDPAKAGDSRWIHRPKMQWDYLEELNDHIESGNGSIRNRIFKSTQQLIALRKTLPALAGQNMESD